MAISLPAERQEGGALTTTPSFNAKHCRPPVPVHTASAAGKIASVQSLGIPDQVANPPPLEATERRSELCLIHPLPSWPSCS